ncbi:hypothetical protein ACVWZL_000526 [Bradyrhizobium sp. GM2.4]
MAEDLNIAGGYPLPFGTICLRQVAITRPQTQHLRCSALWQSPSKIYSAHRVRPQTAGLAMAMALVPPAPNVDLQLSSQPPTSECCDDRLNPPHHDLLSMVDGIMKWPVAINFLAFAVRISLMVSGDFRRS